MSTNFSLPDLRDVTPTAAKRVKRFLEGRDPLRSKELVEPLNIAQLNRQYGMAEAVKPHVETCSFVVPIDMTEDQRAKHCKEKFLAWIRAMNAKGYDLYVTAAYPIRPYQAIYPARDLLTDQDLPDKCECRIDAWFRFRNPKPLRIEVDPALLAPLTING